eukprot:3868431-Prymnesium_polylepis.1
MLVGRVWRVGRVGRVGRVCGCGASERPGSERADADGSTWRHTARDGARRRETAGLWGGVGPVASPRDARVGGVRAAGRAATCSLPRALCAREALP